MTKRRPNPFAVSAHHASVFSFGAAQAPLVPVLAPAPAPALAKPPKAPKKPPKRVPWLLDRHLPTVTLIVERNPALPLDALAALVAQACSFPHLKGATLSRYLLKHGVLSFQQRHCFELQRRARDGLRVSVSTAPSPPRSASVFDFAAQLARKDKP